MSDTGISTDGWLAAGVAAVLAALTGTAAGARIGKSDITDRLTAVEVKVGEHILDDTKNHGAHEAEIRVLKTCVENTAETLLEVRAAMWDLNKNVMEALRK